MAVPGRRASIHLAILPLVALLTVFGGCGDDGDETASAPQPSVPATSQPAPVSRPIAEADPENEPAPDAPAPAEETKPTTGPESEPFPPPEPARARAAADAETAYLAYVQAIDERDGEALCDLLPPSAERELRPPAEGGSCAERIGDSIGYEDPRGYPVFDRLVFNGVESLSVGRDTSTARLTAAVLTEFADRGEPSVESDVAYLERRDGEWRLAKPSGVLYRAIGRPELPPTVIAPP